MKRALTQAFTKVDELKINETVEYKLFRVKIWYASSM
jgi:hypothetical protein